MVHFKRICGCEKGELHEARIFKNGCYENRDQWTGSFNVHIQGEEAHISLLDKGWTRRVERDLAKFCKSKGAKVARWERGQESKERRL